MTVSPIPIAITVFASLALVDASQDCEQAGRTGQSGRAGECYLEGVVGCARKYQTYSQSTQQFVRLGRHDEVEQDAQRYSIHKQEQDDFPVDSGRYLVQGYKQEAKKDVAENQERGRWDIGVPRRDGNDLDVIIDRVSRMENTEEECEEGRRHQNRQNSLPD